MEKEAAFYGHRNDLVSGSFDKNAKEGRFEKIITEKQMGKSSFQAVYRLGHLQTLE